MTPEKARRTFQIVVAATRQWGIGKDGSLPWQLPGDMKFFKQLTSTTSDPSKKNAVIMGRKTWDSLPAKFKPLPGRINVILSRSPSNITAPSSNHASNGNTPTDNAIHTATSLDEALSLLSSPDIESSIENIFVIGGGQIYKESMNSPLLSAIHLTLVETDTPCDTFMPPIDDSQFKLWTATPPRRDQHDGPRYSFLCYTRVNDNNTTTANQSPASTTTTSTTTTTNVTANGKTTTTTTTNVITKVEPVWHASPIPLPVGAGHHHRHEETQYLDLIDRVMREGVFRGDRTGTGTYSMFGATMRFNLRHSFPLLTTKRVFWRGVAEELLWFISGCTNGKALSDKGIKIWDGNGSREYLDSIGLTHREEGDLGPVYGFQWRHFGAQYSDMHADYTGQGVDQLSELIHKIKTNPYDRRLVLTAWNPAALKDMALPPCHMFCQFYVADGELSCQMYQRSCDLGLGVPFNIASYSLLTCMIAQVCGLKAGDFVHVMGDAHVYANHVEPLKEQLKNVPHHFPRLMINPAKTDIDSFTFDDFEIVGYTPHKKIEMQMAV